MVEAVVAVVGLVISLIVNWNEWFGKKQDAWDKMKPDQKNYLQDKFAEEAYTQRELYTKMPEQYPQRVADYFWTFMSRLETQDDFPTWLKKNPRMAVEIPKWDKKYGRGFTQVPAEWKTPALIGQAAQGGGSDPAGNNNSGPAPSVNPLDSGNSKAAGVVGLGALGLLGAFIYHKL